MRQFEKRLVALEAKGGVILPSYQMSKTHRTNFSAMIGALQDGANDAPEKIKVVIDDVKEQVEMAKCGV